MYDHTLKRDWSVKYVLTQTREACDSTSWSPFLEHVVSENGVGTLVRARDDA